MTRKHFVKIADWVCDCAHFDVALREWQIVELVKCLESMSSTFDKVKFMEYVNKKLKKMKDDENKTPYDVTGNIIAYEQGELDENTTIELFQHLINNGMAWTLQGHYGRTATALIRKGLCTSKQ